MRTIEERWLGQVWRVKPCPAKYHHVEGHDHAYSCLDADTNPLPTCHGTGEVLMWPQLSEECPTCWGVGAIAKDCIQQVRFDTCYSCGGGRHIPRPPELGWMYRLAYSISPETLIAVANAVFTGIRSKRGSSTDPEVAGYAQLPLLEAMEEQDAND